MMNGATQAATESLAAALTNVTQSADGRSFDGEITPAALQDAYGDADGFTVEGELANDTHDLAPIAVHLVVGDDGALDTVSFIVGKTIPYFAISLVAELIIVVAAMLLFTVIVFRTRHATA